NQRIRGRRRPTLRSIARPSSGGVRPTRCDDEEIRASPRRRHRVASPDPRVYSYPPLRPRRTAGRRSANRTDFMEYRQLGSTGLSVSVLGFGGATLGDEYGPMDATEGRRAFDAAVDSG